MAAPDFYFAVNAIFRHLRERYGADLLADYWQSMAREYYADRVERWRTGGLPAVADDWKAYFAEEPGSEVEVRTTPDTVELEVRVCPAIKHLREQRRSIVPEFCEHCDYTCGTMAAEAGLVFVRAGGMGACRQRFHRVVREEH